MHTDSDTTQLAWTEETRDRCVDIMFYLRADVEQDVVIDHLNVPPAAVKQIFLLQRSEKGEPVRYKLRDLGLKPSQLVELRRNYMNAVIPALWIRATGSAMSDDELRLLKLLIELRMQPNERQQTLPPIRYPMPLTPSRMTSYRFDVTVVPMMAPLPQSEELLNFGKRVTAIEAAEQERVFQQIEQMQVPHDPVMVQKLRDDERMRIRLFATQLPEMPRLSCDWSDSTKENCLAAYVWLNMGCAPSQIARTFDVSLVDLQRLATICMFLADKPLNSACQTLHIHSGGKAFLLDRRINVRDLVGDFLILRGMSVISKRRSLSFKDCEYLKSLSDEQLFYEREKQWRLADDEGYAQFQNEYRRMLCEAELRILKKLLCTSHKQMGLKSQERKLMRRRIHERIETLEEQKSRNGRLIVYEVFLRGFVKPPADGSEDKKWERIEQLFRG